MPSFINELAFAELSGLVDGSPSLILVDPMGLNAADSLKLRSDLSKAGGRMTLAKASIVRRAVPEQVAAKLTKGGSLALVSGEDIAAVAKLLKELEKEEKLSIKGGLIEGNALDAQEAQKLASLPSRHQLYGMLCYVLAEPITGLARAIQAIKDKNSGGADAAASTGDSAAAEEAPASTPTEA